MEVAYRQLMAESTNIFPQSYSPFVCLFHTHTPVHSHKAQHRIYYFKLCMQTWLFHTAAGITTKTIPQLPPSAPSFLLSPAIHLCAAPRLALALAARRCANMLSAAIETDRLHAALKGHIGSPVIQQRSLFISARTEKGSHTCRHTNFHIN